MEKCPFCGGEPHVRTKQLRYYGRNYDGDKKVRLSVYAFCGRCNARSSPVVEDVVLTAGSLRGIPMDMIEKAFKYWNQREE